VPLLLIRISQYNKQTKDKTAEQSRNSFLAIFAFRLETTPTGRRPDATDMMESQFLESPVPNQPTVLAGDTPIQERDLILQYK